MDNIQFAKRHLAAYSAGQWDEYERQLADDVKYEEVATRTSYRGKDAYVRHVRRWKSTFPDLAAEVRTIVASGDLVICELEWTGTQRGTLASPLGPVPPTNKRGMLRAVLVMEIANGKVRGARHYFDLMTVLRDLELLSAPATQPSVGPEARLSMA